jgi:LysR family nitrogen assimilation transcriptional regulator
MNLKQLDYFVQVASHGSLSRASAALGMGQPALSRHIRGLETELRRNLFHRNGRGVLLTDAGARFLSYAKGILSQLDGARAAMAGTDADIGGRVVVGLPPSVGRSVTVPLVRAFRARYPNAQLSLVEGLSASMQEQLLAGRVDLAVLHNPAASPLVAVEPLLTEALCLASPAAEVNARSNARSKTQLRTADFDELAGLPLISPSAPHLIRTLVEAEAARRGIELNFSLEVDAVGSLLDLVREGCGHAVVPQSVVWAGLPGGGVVARRIVRPRLASLLALVTSTRRPATLLSSGTEAILRALLQQAMGGSRGGATAQAAAT